MRDEDSVANNGLTEIKIVDNQIMNFNNRSDYLEGILNALDGLYYYINDFNSTGILYYEVGDLYNVQIKENTYQCLMLNDEVNVTTGIEEIIYTDIPKKSETDYSKSDKTDRKINQTSLIVDKQNQQIQGIISQIGDRSQKTTTITADIDGLNSRVEDIEDLTTYGESDKAEVELTDINESEPIMIKVHPTSTNISYLYPSENLYPSDTQFMRDRIIRFTRTYEEKGQTLTENIDYTLPDDLLRYSDTVYDEFYLNCESQTCQVIKRCAYNADGTVRALGTEITTDYPYPTIALGGGNYTITLLGYDFGYIYARLMAKNIYTTQFYTKAETESRINQKANEINIGVNQTLTNYSTTNEMKSAITLKANEIKNSVSATYSTKTELGTVESTLTASLELKVNTDDLISEINASADVIRLTAGRLLINSGNFQLDSSGNITCIGGTIGGITINNTGLYYSGSSSKDGFGLWKNGVISHNNSYIIFHAGGNNTNIGGANFRVYQNGSVYAKDFNVIGNSNAFKIYDNDGVLQFQFNKDLLVRFNNEEQTHRWIAEGRGLVGGQYVTHSLWLYDAQMYTITDAIHNQNLFVVKRYGDEASPPVPYSHFYTHVTIGNSGDNRNLLVYGNIYNNGYVITPNSSDRRLKDNIVKSDINATDLINKINHVSFDWNKEKSYKEGHINIGYIAQELMKVDSNFVIYNKEFDTYQIDVLYVLSTATKAIQELQQEIEELKERMK